MGVGHQVVYPATLNMLVMKKEMVDGKAGLAMM